MRKTALAVIIIFTAFTTVPVYSSPGIPNNGKKPSENLGQSPGFSPPGLVNKPVIENHGKLKKAVEFFSVDVEDINSDVRRASDYLKSITDRIRDYFSDHAGVKKSRGHDKSRYGIHKNEGPNGDPKTDYHRSENKYHSPVHRPADPPTDPPTDPPADTVIDLTTWPVANQFISSSGLLYTYYVPPEGSEETYDYIVVVVQSDSQDFVEAESVTTTIVSEMPSLEGLTLVSSTQSSDGSKIDTYLLLASPTDDWSTATKRVKVFYDPFGSFIEAEIRETKTLSIDDILLVPTID